MLVSGGHSSLLEVTDVTVGVEPMGSTIDDAAGEAFDKVARLLGPAVPRRTAHRHRPRERQQRRHRLPARAHQPHATSSGTASTSPSPGSRPPSRGGWRPSSATGVSIDVADVAASFQEAVCDVLTRKAIDAATSRGIEDILIGGGVAANSRLRAMAEERAAARGIRVRVPRPGLCTDNGAMVAALGAELVAPRTYAVAARPAGRLVAADHHRRGLTPTRREMTKVPARERGPARTHSVGG